MKLNGSKLQTIRRANLGMVLRLILTGQASSRSDISVRLGLTKTTLTNLVSELIRDGIIEESRGAGDAGGALLERGAGGAGDAWRARGAADASAAGNTRDARGAPGAGNARDAGAAMDAIGAREASDTRGAAPPGGGGQGRKSVCLGLSGKAPLICGVSLLRKHISVALADMKGRVIDIRERRYSGAPSIGGLKAMLGEMYGELRKASGRDAFAVGISSVGPVDAPRGLLLKPRNFYSDDEEFAVAEFMGELTSLPAFLAHDVSAAATAEKLYGNAKDDQSFIYVGIINGLGVGFYLDSRPYAGEMGQSGELGHVSIDYRGELCECGRRGCVEKYLDFENIRGRVEAYAGIFPNHPLLMAPGASFFDIVQLANGRDPLALILLNEYCVYFSAAISALTLSLGVNRIYVSLPPEAAGGVFERLLEQEVNRRSYVSDYQRVSVQSSKLGLQAALYGSFAIIVNKVFDGELYPAATGRGASAGAGSAGAGAVESGRSEGSA